ncbi:MAG: restriction endonuclease subunit S [Gemmatimonadaceae bacterium]
MSRKAKTTDAKEEATTVLVPKLRFPEFRGEEGWKEKRLGDEGDLLSSLTGKAGGDFDVGEAKFITYMNVFSNTFVDPKGLRFVDVKKDENQNPVSSGDVFFTISSETPEEVGMSSVLLNELENCYLNSFCALFRFFPNKRLNPVFTGYLLRQPLVRNYFTKKAQGSTRFNLSKDVFRSLPFVVPTPAEQQKIAECLSSVDEVIAAQARKVDALKTHKKGLMQLLFPRQGGTQPRLRFPEFQNDGEWVAKQLEKLAQRASGHTPNKSHPEYYNGGIKWVSLADSRRLDSGLIAETQIEISEEGIKNSSAVLHPAGTVLISRDAGVGKSAIMASPMAVSQHFIVWRCDSRQLSNWFLYFVLQNMKPLLEDVATGSTIKTIGLPFFKELRVMVPSVAEQQRVAACLTTLDALITAEIKKLIALKTHKRGLMQQLFPSPEGVEA